MKRRKRRWKEKTERRQRKGRIPKKERRKIRKRWMRMEGEDEG